MQAIDLPRATTPDPGTDAFGALELELRVLIRRAQANAAQMARIIHPQLEASAYPLLAHIHAHPGTRGSDLAMHFGIGRATVSRQLSRLEELGLVHREVDPEDTRGQRITLTAAGDARFLHARDARVGWLQDALTAWEASDVTLLATLLHRYSADAVTWLNSQQGVDQVRAAAAPEGG